MEKDLGYITSLIGDPIRTTVLWTLLDNRAYTATELAISADTSPQNISMHLHKLVQADLLTVERQGRHKYYRFSKPEVAYAIEAIGNLIPNKTHQKMVTNKDNVAIKYCRTCYDHLAGKAGVSITESLLKQKIIIQNGADYNVTAKGENFFLKLGIIPAEIKTNRRTFAKPCLDWSERKHHLAGSLGASLLDKMLSLDWLRKTRNSRAIVITSKGQLELRDKFGVQL